MRGTVTSVLCCNLVGCLLCSCACADCPPLIANEGGLTCMFSFGLPDDTGAGLDLVHMLILCDFGDHKNKHLLVVPIMDLALS